MHTSLIQTNNLWNVCACVCETIRFTCRSACVCAQYMHLCVCVCVPFSGCSLMSDSLAWLGLSDWPVSGGKQINSNEDEPNNNNNNMYLIKTHTHIHTNCPVHSDTMVHSLTAGSFANQREKVLFLSLSNTNTPVCVFQSPRGLIPAYRKCLEVETSRTNSSGEPPISKE